MENGEQKNKNGMKRRLGAFSVFSICTGAAFSSGFFLLPGMAADSSGPSLPLTFLVAGVLMLPAILSISELSAAMPRSGGPYFFVTRSLGPLLGMIGAFGKFIQLILKGAFAFVGVGIYMSLLIEVPVQAVAVGLIVLFTIINLTGIRQTAKTEKVMVIILLVILTYFLIAGTGDLLSRNIDFRERFTPLIPEGINGFFTALALVFISFGGVAQVASVAEEVKEPGRNFPKGILYSLGVSSFFYLAGTVIMVALISSENLQGDQTPAATAAENIVSLPLPVSVMVIAALAAFASTGNAAILSASRYPLALSRDNLFWHRFGSLSKKGIPRNAVILSGALSIALVLLLDVVEIAKTASAFLLFVFLTMCVAVIIFRESGKSEYKPGFKSPLYPWLQIIGCVVYTWLIWESGIKAMAFIGGVFILGFVWYTFGIKEKPQLSAAIYYLFGRIARHGTKNTFSGGVGISIGGPNLAAVVEHAIFIDLEEEKEFSDVLDDAANALVNHIGGKQKEIASSLKEEVRHWKNPVKFNISAAPALLEGIEQPEMIIIRGKIITKNGELGGLIVIVEDPKASDRLLQILTQLEIAINHHDFSEKWENAENAAEIKKTLIHNVRSLSIKIKSEGITQELNGQRINEIDLPRHSVIGAVYRDGKLIVSDNDTRIKEGDEVIIIAQGDAFEELAEKYSEALLE